MNQLQKAKTVFFKVQRGITTIEYILLAVIIAGIITVTLVTPLETGLAAGFKDLCNKIVAGTCT
ncbi:MAG: hypothetical protein PSV40_13645 [Polaromonas sp.]|uniref:Flp family type IVb pilin n=1 Tax=Polaromonas sp. TaxID=1869339 RepID=UPI0024884509|nr:hypothetical protein [Polaromonas sp.]MDI1270129.1 hypothetical protein [Polaromonas sp.]